MQPGEAGNRPQPEEEITVSPSKAAPSRRWCALLVVSTGAFCWMAMMVVHEFGHVLHAWASGGRIVAVELHPLAISGTLVDPNPHPGFVTWGGPIWGCVIPLAAWLAWSVRSWPFDYLVRFFAGFCLIANGAYLGAGVVNPVGDALSLMQHGTPAWGLGLFGLVTVSSGLWLWHGLGPRFGLGSRAEPADPAAAVMMGAGALTLAAIEVFYLADR